MNNLIRALFARLTSVAFCFALLSHFALGAEGAINEAPQVTLTSPRDGSIFSTLSAITVAAAATDDGAIDKVEFFDNGALIGADATSPYSMVVSLSEGAHALTATATDNLGAARTSSVVSITVNRPNQAPVVSLTGPTNGSTFMAGEAITFSANASDDGTITKVEFFADGALMGTDETAPYSSSAKLSAGVHSITVRAWDDTGSATTLPPIQITVTAPAGPPQVELKSAQADKVIPAPGLVVLAANASDDGSIVEVEFSQDLASLRIDSEAPYETTVSGLTAGLYTFFARARDNSGNTTTSASISVRVVGASEISSITLNGTSVTITASATEGVAFDLQRTTDFVVWEAVERKTATGSTLTFTDSATNNAIYRVVAVAF